MLTYPRTCSTARSSIKRGLDFVGATLGMIVLSPVIAGVALAVRRRMGSPVIFRQARVGRRGTLFCLRKFRTMTDARDEKGNLLPDEVRVTRLGASLRRYRLDELPELYNVWVGDMSLVGPRPLPPQHVRSMSFSQARRHEVRPGLTGWAQVSGNTLLGTNEKTALDVWYLDHRSVRLDFTILIQTVGVLLGGERVRQARVEEALAYADRGRGER